MTYLFGQVTVVFLVVVPGDVAVMCKQPRPPHLAVHPVPARPAASHFRHQNAWVLYLLKASNIQTLMLTARCAIRSPSVLLASSLSLQAPACMCAAPTKRFQHPNFDAYGDMCHQKRFGPPNQQHLSSGTSMHPAPKISCLRRDVPSEALLPSSLSLHRLAWVCVLGLYCWEHIQLGASPVPASLDLTDSFPLLPGSQRSRYHCC